VTTRPTKVSDPVGVLFQKSSFRSHQSVEKRSHDRKWDMLGGQLHHAVAPVMGVEVREMISASASPGAVCSAQPAPLRSSDDVEPFTPADEGE
jgi:hypothetical protein